MMLFLLVGRALAVDCPSSVDVVEGLASAAETQFAALDSEGLGRTAGDLETALSCLAQPIPAVLAAKVHRADALAAFAAMAVSPAMARHPAPTLALGHRSASRR